MGSNQQDRASTEALSDRIAFLDPAAAPQGTDAEASGQTTRGEPLARAHHSPQIGDADARPKHSGRPPHSESHHEGLLAGGVALLALAGVIAGWVSAAGG